MIPFAKSREEVRVSDTEMTFDPIIQPGEAKNLNGPRAVGAISVTVKLPMEKHVSRLGLHTAPKAGFYKGACQDDGRIALQMAVAGVRAASRKCLVPSLN